MTHDFRPGDVVEWREFPGDGCCYSRTGEVHRVADGRVHIRDSLVDLRGVKVTLVKRADAPTEHPSRARALLSLGAAREALEDAIDHLIKAGQPEEVAGQCVVRTRTAAEGAQQCIQHATMALYWLLHERLGS